MKIMQMEITSDDDLSGGDSWGIRENGRVHWVGAYENTQKENGG